MGTKLADIKHRSIKEVLNSDAALDEILVKGWVKTKRDSRNFSFIEINDGSSLNNIQVLAEENIPEACIRNISTGTSLEIVGSLMESPGKGQKWELKAKTINILGEAAEYPLQKKRHTDEFLRTIAHLRPRTNKYGALYRIRSESSYAIHKFFHDRGFFYIHTPVITGSDCEGAGEMFRVTTLPANLPEVSGTDIFNSDFFGKEANLTVSGQLEAEAFACALGKVYTFGPTFRAEKSNTPRHAAEFWMVEPEAAFADLDDNMNLAEDFIKSVTEHVISNCTEDIELFKKFVDKNLEADLKVIVEEKYMRISYREAVKYLQNSGKHFEFPTEFGCDLQAEHERYLCEEKFKKPVFVYDFPKTIKPFYMRINDDNETVAAMDLLVPRVGELIGGSQREERYTMLKQRLQETGMPADPYWWYMDLRKFGSVPHSGFGLGFERLLMAITGVTNIRDVMPFPRTHRNLEF